MSNVATIGNTLTTSEFEQAQRRPFLDIKADMQVQNLTVKQLSGISLILLQTKIGLNAKTPELVLAAFAIEELTDRAIKGNLDIFTL